MHHFTTTENDYAALIGEVAQMLRGEPNAQLSKAHELRFGTHGSLSIDLDKGTFYDHESSTGGGVLDLVCYLNESIKTRGDAANWLKQQGLRTLNEISLGRDEKCVFEKHQKTPNGKVSKPSPTSPHVLLTSCAEDADASPPSRLVATYDYCDEGGALVLQVLRYEPKKFMQRRPEGSGWNYKVQGVRVLPYRLPDLLAQPDAPVFLVEGEKDADRLAELGLVATCNAGGAGKWKKEHSEFVRGRVVIILPDNDEAGAKHAKQAIKNLNGIAASVLMLELPGLPEKGDVSDWLNAGGTAQELQALVAQAQQASSAPDTPPEGTRRSQTDMLVSFIRERFALMHDTNGDTYAQDLETGEVRRTASRQFSDRVAAAFFANSGLAVRANAWGEALNTVQAIARFEGQAQQVNVRIAGGAGVYWVDLCQPGNSRAVKITAQGWEVVEHPAALFVRSDAMQPLPEPQRGGSIAPLWSIANVPQDVRPLVLAWLLDSMRPDTPYPGLELVGEAGSGKSTAAEALRRLIDPNACNLRGAPKATEDIFISAGVNHIVAYENLSHLSPQMQDALCILSTGGGFAKRQLFTDGEEHVISVQRPWMVNGIAVCVTQQDLIDRAISIECPVVTARVSSRQQWADFDAALPGLLGALYSLMADTLRHLPAVELPAENRPRLVDFVLLGMAMAQASGGSAQTFLDTFNKTRIDAVSRALDGSPVATAVLDFLDENPQGIQATMKDIFKRLEHYKPLGAEAWPRTPKGLGDALRRAATALRQLGIDCKSLGRVGGSVLWEIKPSTSTAKGKPVEKAVEVTV